MKALFRQISRTFFPRRCFGCSIPDFWVCHTCLVNIPLPSRTPLSWAESVFDYQNKIIRKAIWALKFSGKFSILEDLQPQIQKRFEKFISDKNIGDNYVLIPIPITKRSQNTRGYNQSLFISQMLVPYKRVLTNSLLKTTNHLSQNKIKNRNERLENVKNSFTVVQKEKIKDMTIILVDDVTTTGATLTEARDTLLKAGAKKVFGFTIAH